MTERTTCVVVGGGPAGMLLGLLLARAGIEVTVLEKHGDFLRDFRGDTVHPSTLRLLDELGLGERFAALPQSRLTEVAFPDEDGRPMVFGDLSRLRTAHPYIAMVPQWDLLDLLASAAREETSFTLRMNAEVTGLIREDGAVRGVRYRCAGGPETELRAELTVGADGRWSAVRRAAGLRPKEYAVPMDAWWLRVPRDMAVDTPSLVPSTRRGEFAVTIPREGYFQIAYLAPKGADARLRAEGIERFRERLASAVPRIAGEVHTLGSMDEVKHLDVRLNRLRRWHSTGLLCIGDAAHAMSPLGGVGINLAVQDAVAAARLLAEPLARGTVGDADLAKVAARRRLPTAVVQGMQRILHRVLVKPVLDGRRAGPPKPMMAFVRRVPKVTFLPAYLIGIGVRAEHAPAYARRSPAPDH
ncbi:hypothetical protein CFN78_07185 [Amycolatopsis antarctica]|uniref:FAD-binding domain-containing protein n=1 Tax=Amycolatopsis antarctica TaxID=1854586 RepID=A0A263D936_9PSEU|nr:FAD-dependent oxidoreductase [Amycolatopsis antarctica]OZM74057.1 hypothetical protein CFN78_07185 [Amycolatopsis antarctica]